MSFTNKTKMISTSKQTHLFISTTNCLISGGVETILRNGALLPSQPMANSSTDDVAAITSIENLISDDDFMAPVSSTSKNGNNKSNFASSLIHSVKSSTATLESQLRGMAIRAASNETKKADSTSALVLYSLNGTTDFEEIGCTEFKPVLEEKEQYCIPIVLQDSLDRQRGYLQVRIVIRSGAQVLGMKQNRQYVIASGTFPLSRFPNTYGNVSTNASSNFVNEGVISLTIVPDSSSPPPFRMGWSLTDPSSYAVFNRNLVKPYHFNHFIAMERSIESTVTLPICAAVTELIVNSAKISANHSICTSSKIASHFMVYKDGMQAMRKGNVDAQIQIFRFIKFSDSNDFQGQIPCRIQFRSPVDIFEQDLGSGDVVVYNIPLDSASNVQTPNHQPCFSIPFYPPVAKPGGTMKIGTLRFEIPYEQYSTTSSSNFLLLDMEIGNGPAATASNIGKHNAYQGYLEIDPNLDVEGGTMMNVPIFSSDQNGVNQQIGLLTVRISARTINKLDEKTRQEANVAPASDDYERFPYADNGLLEFIGLQHKVRLTDTLDRTSAQASAPFNADKSTSLSDVEHVRYRQLNTMGHFLHPTWLRKHAIYRIQCVKELEKRFDLYLNAISSTSEMQMESNLRKGPSCFRPSSSKSESTLSGIPINVHIQSLTVEKLANREEVAMFSNVTCGAPADHARGFTASQSTANSNIPSRPTGGLLHWEKLRDELAQKLHEAKTELIQGVASYFQSTAVKEGGQGHYIPTSNTSIQNIRYKVRDLEQRLTELTWEISLRRSNVFSQALSIAVSSYLSTFSNVVSRADCNKQTSALIDAWIKHGFLLCFEGLLSAAGKETGMIEDAAVAIDMLRMAGVMLVCDQKQADLLDFGTDILQEEEPGRKVPVHGSQFIQWIKIMKQSQQPNCYASNVTIVVQVGLTSQYYNTHVPISLREFVVPFYPMLFQMGVDIRQWGANAGANVRNQFIEQKVKLDRQLAKRESSDELKGIDADEAPELSATETCDLLMKINQGAFKRLNLYAHRIVPLSNDNTQINNSSSMTSKVHPIVTSLWQYIDKAHGKVEHGVLDACAEAACKLGGGSIVFCKSGKDRTAMQVTYKQAQFIHKFICTADTSKALVETSEEQKQVIVADSTFMRLHGTRLMICEKNVGQFKYAFNALQAKFMPDVLKPPPAAMAGFLKGGRVFSKEGLIES